VVLSVLICIPLRKTVAMFVFQEDEA